MTYFLLGLAALLAVLFGAQAFMKADPKKLARWLRVAGGVAALGGAAYLLVRGAIHLALPLGASGWWLIAGRRGFGVQKAEKTSGQTTRATTDHLDVELDLDSGEMTGRVLKGFFAGRTLDGMSGPELVHLWQDCRYMDQKSARIVEAYLDREHPNWRDHLARGEAEMASGEDGRMSVAEAAKILGVKTSADADEVRRAHRELMMKMHPDRGGSPYLAAKINEAKDVLLGEG